MSCYRKSIAIVLVPCATIHFCTPVFSQNGEVGRPVSSTGEKTHAAGPSGLSRVIPGDYLWLLKYEKDVQRLGGYRTILEQLRQCKVPSPGRAEGVAASRAKLEAVGLSAHEGAEVVGLIVTARDLPEFASRGDMIWIVHILIGDQVAHAAWVSSTTGRVRWMFPFKPPKPPPPAGKSDE